MPLVAWGAHPAGVGHGQHQLQLPAVLVGTFSLSADHILALYGLSSYCSTQVWRLKVYKEALQKSGDNSAPQTVAVEEGVASATSVTRCTLSYWRISHSSYPRMRRREGEAR